jgi:hypothetical protein
MTREVATMRSGLVGGSEMRRATANGIHIAYDEVSDPHDVALVS